MKSDLTSIPQPAIDIIIATAQAFDVGYYDILSPRRPDHLAKARQVAMKFIRDLNKYSLGEIGSYFSNRDHTTVIHAIKKFPFIESSPTYAPLVQRVRSLIATPIQISKTSVQTHHFKAEFLKSTPATFSGSVHPLSL